MRIQAVFTPPHPELVEGVEGYNTGMFLLWSLATHRAVGVAAQKACRYHVSSSP
jgi:hypothetical protein